MSLFIGYMSIIVTVKYRVHYESNAHDFIVTRPSIAARSDRSDNVVESAL